MFNANVWALCVCVCINAIVEKFPSVYIATVLLTSIPISTTLTSSYPHPHPPSQSSSFYNLFYAIIVHSVTSDTLALKFDTIYFVQFQVTLSCLLNFGQREILSVALAQLIVNLWREELIERSHLLGSITWEDKFYPCQHRRFVR